MKYKKDLADLDMELSFLEDQVNAAELNEFKLQMRYDELVDEIGRIREDEEADEGESETASKKERDGQERKNFYTDQMADNLQGNAYFQHVCESFGAYANYIERKNARLRESNSRKPGGNPKNTSLGGMIKESQEEIQELSAPFKKMFENAIEKTKEEIV